jgi:O-antigen/teichoic acid export membrane protein
MSLSEKVVHGTLLLTGGQVASQALSFARNLILARLLTKADFGVAASLSVSLSLLELVSRMAFGMQIVQAPAGDEPEYQRVAHAVQAVVGTVSALLVVAAAWPMSASFHQPHLTWAFAAMAIVPLARGFVHLDLARVQRSLVYRPQVAAEFSSQLLATLAAWPLGVWLGDFRVVLWIMLGKEAPHRDQQHV